MRDDNPEPKRGETERGGDGDNDTDGGVPTVVYRVRPGDDLSSIASQFYGRPDLWVFIFVANPGDIHGLDGLPDGKVLNIPVLPAWGDLAVFSDVSEPWM